VRANHLLNRESRADCACESFFPLRSHDIIWYSYTDYHDLDFKVSHWGAHYPRLLELKKRFDPQGLFYGHHAVGSELWSSDGNCRVGA